MTHAVAQKHARETGSRTHQAPSAGTRGAALAPPDYGIGFVDQSSGEGLIQRQAVAPGDMPSANAPPRLNHTGLPNNLKAGIESLSGLDMSDVRVHFNSSRPARLRALAYTQGTDIHVAPGQARHLPHEAWHVVQQKQGRVTPTVQLKGGIPVNDDEGLEHEANAMGILALATAAKPRVAQVGQGPSQGKLAPRSRAVGTGTIQRYLDDENFLPKKEKTFKGWCDVWWGDPNRFSRSAYDHIEMLYDKLLAKDGTPEAVAAYDAAYYMGDAYYLKPETQVWTDAVQAAATKIENDHGGNIDEETIHGTWIGMEETGPEEYLKAVGAEVQRRKEQSERAAKDKQEAERQKTAAEEAARRQRQSKREWTGQQVIKACGYGGKTSVSPIWGGRTIMINQRNGYHFTQFYNNYDAKKEFPEGTDVDDIYKSVFGGTVEQSFHVTQELFGPVDKGNPHYHVTGVYKPAGSGKKTKPEEKPEAVLKGWLADEENRIKTLLRSSAT
jgi:hypothetical protein